MLSIYMHSVDPIYYFNYLFTFTNFKANKISISIFHSSESYSKRLCFLIDWPCVYYEKASHRYWIIFMAISGTYSYITRHRQQYRLHSLLFLWAVPMFKAGFTIGGNSSNPLGCLTFNFYAGPTTECLAKNE